MGISQEQQRTYLRLMRNTYELLEQERLETPWMEPTDAQKADFDQFMSAAWRHRKPPQSSGLVEWYRSLLDDRQ